MDHFLFARNPLKKAAPTGLQGYIIDTVKGTWLKVEVFIKDKEPAHTLTMIAGTGNNKEDALSATRASRWYDTILRMRKIEANVEVVLPTYTGNEAPPAERVEYLQGENLDSTPENIDSTPSPVIKMHSVK